ncbi:MAG: V-type ATPase subunit [Brevinematales bacterium]|nr:V-type ATPase subunit [Brevinematales bacterium]
MFGLEFTAVNPKVRNWLSFLLKNEEMEFLIGAGLNDVIEFIRTRLKKENIDTGELMEIEKVLKNGIVAYIKSGLNFIVGKPALFLEKWLEAYRIENLKMVARALVTRRPIDFLYTITEKDWLRIETVRDLRTFEEFQEFLRRTDYHDLAVKTFPNVIETGNTFFWEVSLDNFYAQHLRGIAQKMSRSNKSAIERLLFFSMEVNRFMRIYRLRFEYQLSIEETMTIIPNIFKSLSRRKYQELVSSETPAAFLENISHMGILAEPVTDIALLENALNKAIVKRTHRYLGGIPFQFGIFLSFIILKSMDVRKYIILLEGKRAGIDRKILENLLY